MRIVTIPVKSTSQKDKVRKFLEFTYKFHKLTDKELDILLVFVMKFYSLLHKYNTKDLDLVNKLLFDVDIKKEIREELGIREGVFDNYLTIFRKKGVIKGKTLNPSYLPPEEPFELHFKFL
jgi:predicted RNA binding protein with dsRBD fold (UPF0201 family)